MKIAPIVRVLQVQADVAATADKVNGYYLIGFIPILFIFSGEVNPVWYGHSCCLE